MEKLSDAQFAERALSRLQGPTASAGFEAALLAGYDGWRARRASGPLAGLKGALGAVAHVIWPGVSAWLPAGVLAASLLVGLALGAALPAMEAQNTGFSLERTPGFTLLTDQDESL